MIRRKNLKLADFSVESIVEEKVFLTKKDGQKDPTPYDYICEEALTDGFYEVVLNGKAGIVNSDGEVIIPPTVYDYFSRGVICDNIAYFTCCKDRKSRLFGLVNQYGKEILNCEWNNIETIYGFRSIMETGWFCIQRNEKWGCFNVKTGKQIAPIFDELKPFQNGYAPFKMNNLWGCIDENGDIIIEPKYGFEFNFNSDGFALVQEGGYFERVPVFNKLELIGAVTKVITPQDVTILSRYTPSTYACSDLGDIREEAPSTYRIIEDGESASLYRTIETKKLIPLDNYIIILSNGDYEDFNLYHYTSGGSFSAMDYNGNYIPITDDMINECKNILKPKH